MFLREVRTSLTLWTTPVIVLAVLYCAVIALKEGVYLWSDATQGLTTASLFLNPLLGGVTAAAAGRRERGGFSERIAGASDNAWRARLFFFAGITAAPALAGSLGVVAVVIYMNANGAEGDISWIWLVATTAGAVLCCAIGFALGIVFEGRWYVSVAVAVVLYFGWSLLQGSGLPFWIIQSFPTTFGGSNPNVRYIYATFIGQIFWYLGLAVVLTSVAFFRKSGVTQRVRRVTTATAAVAASVGLFLIISTNGQITTGYNARDYDCTGGSVELCLTPGYDRGADALQGAFYALNERAAGTPLVATKLEQNVEGIGESVSAGARAVYVEDLSPGFEGLSVSRYVQKYGGQVNCTEDPDSAYAEDIVTAWLVGEPSWLLGAGGPGQDAAQRFADSDEATRRAWFATNYDAYQACSIQLAVLP